MGRKINKIGLYLAGFHIFLVLIVLMGVEEANRIWLWMIFLVLDFPVSMLSIWGMDAMLAIWGQPPFSSVSKDFIYDNWPAAVHLIFGTIWWYYIPILIDKLLSKLFQKRN